MATQPDKSWSSGSSRRGFRRLKDKAKRAFGDKSAKTLTSSWASSSDSSTLSLTSDFSVDGTWDFDACVEVIGGINFGGLTVHQQEAIRQLRAASSRSLADSTPGGSGAPNTPDGRPRHVVRREAKLFGANKSVRRRDLRSPLLTKELVACFREVAEAKDDADMQKAGTDVLETYGGQIFDGIFEVAPKQSSKKNFVRKISRRISEGEQSMKPAATTVKESLIDFDSEADCRAERRSSQRRQAAVNFSAAVTFARLTRSPSLVHEEMDEKQGGRGKVYCPPEWNALTLAARTKLSHLLSWEELCRWEFDVVEVAELSRKTMRVSFGEASPEAGIMRMSLDDNEAGTNADAGETTPGRARQQFCPLLLVGWAILCSPHAQDAMEGSLLEGNCPNGGRSCEGHGFVTDLNVDPERVCNFLREVEKGYRVENPYHNNVHGADVTQTLHCLLQFIGREQVDRIYSGIEVFSVLLAATFHDVGHPGTNNLFEKNARTPLAIQYNDASILENMHSARGHAMLMGEKKQQAWDIFEKWTPSQVSRARTVMMAAILATDMSHHFPAVGELASLMEKVQEDYAQEKAEEKAKKEAEKEAENEAEEKRRREEESARNSEEKGGERGERGEGESAGASNDNRDENHSSQTNGEEVNEAAADTAVDASEKEKEEGPRPILSILAEEFGRHQDDNGDPRPLEAKARELATHIIKFLLHAADISNPAKGRKLMMYWADGALAEFFAQGDREAALRLPISPLCDRKTVKKADSQLGFLKFVIRPTYVLVGQILPRVEKEVMPIIDGNIEYWVREKKRMSMIATGQGPMIEAMRRASDNMMEQQAIEEGDEEVDDD